jgi:hypothetical protein
MTINKKFKNTTTTKDYVLNNNEQGAGIVIGITHRLPKAVREYTSDTIVCVCLHWIYSSSPFHCCLTPRRRIPYTYCRPEFTGIITIRSCKHIWHDKWCWVHYIICDRNERIPWYIFDSFRVYLRTTILHRRDEAHKSNDNFINLILKTIYSLVCRR